MVEQDVSISAIYKDEISNLNVNHTILSFPLKNSQRLNPENIFKILCH